jgi:predicted DNA-binding transcriptional regulator AlpA
MNTLRVKAVAKKMGVSVATVWNLTRGVEAFPKPFRLNDDLRVTVWDEADIDQYLFTRKHGENHGNSD